jgi:hypothetical protein
MDKIASALVKAQKAFGPALKTSNNPHFKSRYADLSACIEAVIDGLNSNGIALIQKQHPSESGVAVETIFVHESGETFSAGILSVPAAKQDPQGYGSALTYARRYSLMAACGIAPEDDDGNAAQRSKPMARAAWLADCRSAIMHAINVGELKRILAAAIDVAMNENDGAAVDQLNAWADEKRAQAKTAAEQT